MEKYIVKHTDNVELADEAFVGDWSWGYSYEPRVSFRICHTDDRLIVRLRAYESDPVARIDKKHGPVCNDSCMEFFFSPSRDNSAGYFNFEVNSYPTYLFEYGLTTGPDRVYIDGDDDPVPVCTRGEDGFGPFWQIDVSIAYSLIRRYVPGATLSSGDVIRGNVYKCGCTDQPDHYGSWSHVDTPGPNFHKPEFFGELIIE